MNVAPDPATSRPTAQAILVDVCRKHGVSKAEIRGGCRRQALVRARHEAIFRIRHEIGKSMPWIARYLGLRNHTSVFYALRTYAGRVEAERAS